MIRRARTLAVTAILAAGALGVISSTQTWLTVTLREGSDAVLLVPGASALPVLAPLSLAVLALGGALSIVGVVLRSVFGALTVLIAAVLAWLTGAIILQRPTAAAASTVTEATGITGLGPVADLVEGVSVTPWPAVALVGWVVLLAAGVLVLVSARAWKGTGRRYRTDAAPAPATAAAPDEGPPDRGARPHDAIY